MNTLRKTLTTVVFASAFIAFASAAALAQAAQEVVLYNFDVVSGDVVFPEGGMVFDQQGNLYGAAQYGGAHSEGGIYELSPGAGGGWTEQVIYSFAGGSDGKTPYGTLLIDAVGNLYGSTSTGGSSTNCSEGCGQVYELSPTASGWTKTVLHSFTGGGDGSGPISPLIFDAAGNLYGAATNGGLDKYGVVFELSPSASGWTETVLYSFRTIDQGILPNSGLLFDSEGRLYGATFEGGTSTICFQGCGTVYQLTPPTTGTFWTFKRLFSFNLTDGEEPTNDSLVMDAAGNLYGTTDFGGTGAFDSGTVYELSPTSTGAWKESVLHSFGFGYTGALPDSGLTFDAFGNLWGTASAGGIDVSNGIVYELTPQPGGQWSFARIYGFKGGTADGASPRGKPTFDAAGNLYGTTEVSGTKNEGTVYELLAPLPKQK